MEQCISKEWLNSLRKQENEAEGMAAFLNRPSMRLAMEKEAQDLLDKVLDYDASR